MGSSKLEKALQLNATAFPFSYPFPLPLRFHPSASASQATFLIHTKPKEMKNFLVLLVTTGLVVLCYFHILCVAPPQPNLPLWIILFQYFLLGCGTFGLINQVFLLILCYSNFLWLWNGLLTLGRQCLKDFPKKEDGLDFVGSFQLSLSYTSAILVLIMVPSVLLYELDPFPYLVGVGASSFPHLVLLLPFRLIITTYVMLGVKCVVIQNLLILLERSRLLAASVPLVRGYKNPFAFMRAHNGFFIMYSTLERYTAPLNGLLTILSLVVGITCNFFSIKMHRIIPLPQFVLFPIVSGITLITSFYTLDCGVNIHKTSKEMLEERRKIYRRKSFLGRRLRGMQSLRLYAGIGGYRVCSFEEESTKNYWSIYAGYTVNLMVSVKLH